jgi:hypothetical protein
MRSTDAEEFGLMFASVAQVYGRDVTPSLAEIYWRALAQYDLQAVRKSFDLHVKNPDVGQFFPKPADLIRAIEGGSEDRALVAWSKVEDAFAAIGGHRSVVFDDPITMRVIEDMGGWIKQCDGDAKSLPHQAREFVTRYRAHVQRGDFAPRHATHLLGRAEYGNGTQFARYNGSPAMVGDRQLCLAVQHSGRSGGAASVGTSVEWIVERLAIAQEELA